MGQPLPEMRTDDARASERMMTLFAIGKLTIEGAESICLVRNISDGGVRIDTGVRLHVGQQVTIEMRGLHASIAEVRWTDGSSAGLAFQIAVAAFAMGRGSPDGIIVPRGPRFRLERAARVQIEDARSEAMIDNIALGGLRLLVADPSIVTGSLATVRCGATILRGTVRWRDGEAVGLHFPTPLASTALAAILRSG